MLSPKLAMSRPLACFVIRCLVLLQPSPKASICMWLSPAHTHVLAVSLNDVSASNNKPHTTYNSKHAQQACGSSIRCTGPCGPCTELYYDLKPERGLENVDLEDDSRWASIAG